VPDVRLTSLLGSHVLDREGRDLGKVHDVRFTQEGPLLGSWGAALRFQALLVGPSALGVRLGFERRDVKGPWPLKAAFHALHGRMVVAGWDQLASIEPERIRLRVGLDELASLFDESRPSGRVWDAGLEVLDRQMIDPDGRMAGNVDDLELAFPEGTGAPWVSAVLAGPGALSRRLGGRLGGVVAAVHDRLQDRNLEGPARISFGTVARIDTAVRLTVGHEDLPTSTFETWVRDRIVAKIPGSDG
jgi:sporulation protein YlmC with PRC-barrel domain